MNILDEMIIRTDKDGTKYRFIWKAMKKAFDEWKKEEGVKSDAKKMKELAEKLKISDESVKNHLQRDRNAPGAHYPRIKEMKEYGRILKGDEYAFLIPCDPKKLSAKKQSNSRRGDVDTIFDMLYCILSCYGASDCFNYIPCTDNSNGAWNYFERDINKVRKTLNMKFLGRRDSTDFQKLERIINETEIFIKSYSIPGVVERWKDINPQINLFDCAFEIIEECGMEKASLLYRNGVLKYLPCKRIIKAKKEYFAEKALANDRYNLKYSEERIFQDELLRTLIKVFESDFKDIYAEKRVT